MLPDSSTRSTRPRARRINGTTFERFADKVAIGDECWEWTGCVRPQGYGVMRTDDGLTKRAHRVSYELSRGPIPDGFCICHTCDHPGCVKPSHLFLGTRADNAADMDRKGRRRNGPRYGEAVNTAKLTSGDVLAIRARYDAGERPVDIAADYGIDRHTPIAIGQRRTWRHIGESP